MPVLRDLAPDLSQEAIAAVVHDTVGDTRGRRITHYRALATKLVGLLLDANKTVISDGQQSALAEVLATAMRKRKTIQTRLMRSFVRSFKSAINSQ
jgi:predicted ATP-dependent protease